jgi:hypothetical protein
MNTRFLNFTILMAPEGDATGGGGSGAPAAEMGDMSHADAISTVFADKPAAPPTTQPDATPPAPKDTKDKTPAPPAAPPADDPLKNSLHSKIGKKPADQKPADQKAPDAVKLPEDDLVLSDKASADTKAHFAKQKEIIKQLRGEFGEKEKTYQQRLAELEKRGSVDLTPELQSRDAQIKELSDRLAVFDLQNHPQFVKEFGEPKQKLLANLDTVLKNNGLTDINVAALASKPYAELAKSVNELVSKIGPFEQTAFINDMRQLYELETKSKAQLANAAELKNNLQAKTEAEHRLAFDKVGKSLGALDDFAPSIEVDPNASPELKAEIEAFNKSAKGLRTEAESIMFKARSPEQIAQVSYEAALCRHLLSQGIPRMNKEFSAAVQIIEQLRTEIAALKGSRPTPTGGAGGGDDGPKGMADMSHEEAAAAAFRQR